MAFAIQLFADVSQIMFLWTGLLTAVFGVICYFILPSSPLTAWFLSPEDRVLAVERIAVNQQGIKNTKWKKKQFLEALKDPVIYCYIIFFFFGKRSNESQERR